MVDAARQMLDELMGRNRNLHPSEACKKVNWEDPDYCQYYVVKFCPHDLFINTRADLGPCNRIHDDEAKDLYSKSRPSVRKRQYEDDFLRFCNTMLNDVDRKIQKGKQRLALMQKDQPPTISHASKLKEQVNNLNARIKKLLSEAEEAGIRGDVDQAQDLMTLCEQLKDERENLIAQYESLTSHTKEILNAATAVVRAAQEQPVHEKEQLTQAPLQIPSSVGHKSPISELNENSSSSMGGLPGGAASAAGPVADKPKPWLNEINSGPEKQMEVCEVCGAFLIVGDAQQRIEDHLMGKQHLGYFKLREAVNEIHDRRKKEREEEDKRRKEERSFRSRSHYEDERKRDFRNHDKRGGHDHHNRYPDDRSYRHKSHRHRSRSRGSSSRSHRRYDSRERSRSRSRSHSRH